MGWSTFFHIQKCKKKKGVGTLARMVCALFSSFWECRKRMKKIESEKVLHGASLTEGGGGIFLIDFASRLDIRFIFNKL